MTQIYFEFSGGISEIETNGERSDITKRSYVHCGLGSWMDIYQKESIQTSRVIKNFKVELFPHTLYEIFAISPSEVAYEDITVEDIFGKNDASLLYEELESTNNGERMIEIFEKYFTKKLFTSSIKKGDITSYFLENHSNLEALSKDLGYSQRWIQKQYLEIFGISFKKIQNNKRFLNALNKINNKILQGEKNINFTDITSECNYFDQAHFIKEFKKYTGKTPNTYFREKYQNSLNFFW